MVRTVLSSLMLASLAVCLSACGGGGGGSSTPSTPPPPTQTLVAGTYHLTSFSAQATPPSNNATIWGTAVTNDAGGIDVAGTINVATRGANEPFGPQSYELSVTPQGVVEWRLGGVVTHRGGVSDDGQVVLLGSVGAGLDPGMLILIKSSGSNGEANFAGTYFMGHALEGLVGYGPLTMDGAGALAGGAWQLRSDSGSIANPPYTGTVSVAPTGAVDLLLPLNVWRGGLSQDGQFCVVCGDDQASPSAPFLYACVRTGSGGTPQGAYYSVSLEFVPGSVIATTGVTTFGTMGTWARTGHVNTEGAVAEGDVDGTYVTNLGNGSFTMNRAGRVEDLQGHASPDGRYLIIAGGSAAGSTPVLWLCCRR